MIEAPQFWRTRPDESVGTHSDGWHGRIRVGRFQFSFALWRHRYFHYHSGSPDRWVFQPSFIYDGKAKRAS